mmetsp:Transcript_69473/g.224727  ORF Transcript_69473/g.224727 Transcript_69473/m.224727 type:complete len:212 (+) Transcript_69473:246-881(+)
MPIEQHVKAEVEVVVVVVRARDARGQGTRRVDPHCVHVLHADLLRRPEVGEHVLRHRAEAQQAAPELHTTRRLHDDDLGHVRHGWRRGQEGGRVPCEDPHAHGCGRRPAGQIRGVLAPRRKCVHHVLWQWELKGDARIPEEVSRLVSGPEVPDPRGPKHGVHVAEAEGRLLDAREDAAAVGERWELCRQLVLSRGVLAGQGILLMAARTAF